ncbi:hypothetical protein [Methylovorus glucosotrophus]|uniref:Uncharacterized protein n=1 Tax=Methylovorus glucosotrophus (strain SIP3-4) TaxID=582744 RepID=C6XEN5_METGS|nr:hypothetical protein [Methylovorus glucosotrophus]ACT52092.1 hypothetical protein Msip34_2868 [Methylovorus glucosotrophus SIP3-4]
MITKQNDSWTHRNDVVIQINPAKRKKVWLSLSFIGVLILLGILSTDQNSPLMKWAKHKEEMNERNALAPTMRALAESGKPDALIWIAKNFPGEKTQELETLIANGNTEAMMVIAKAKFEANDVAGAKQLIAKAASLGNVMAINDMTRLK